MITLAQMRLERVRLGEQLGTAKASLSALRAEEEAWSAVVASLEHQLHLWDQLIEWGEGRDPCPEY